MITIFLSVTCYNVTMLTNNYYNDFFELGQQKINFSFFELSLPDDDPVYTLKKVMEELDFSGLLANCSDKGRTGYNPIMMYAVVTYANMRGIRSVDRIVDLCERDLAFIWLTRGQKPKRDAFYDFKNRKLTSDILDDLNYQFMRRLQKEGLVTLKELLILELNDDILLIDGDVEHLILQKEQQLIIGRTLEKLRETDRKIFIMYYYRYKKIEEIAETLKMNPQTVKTRLRRGRETLKRILLEEGYDASEV